MLDKNPIDENILEEIYQVIEPFIDVIKDNPTKKVVPDWENIYLKNLWMKYMISMQKVL